MAIAADRLDAVRTRSSALGALLGAALLLSPADAAHAFEPRAPHGSEGGVAGSIRPMTVIGPRGAGYFEDPQPVRRAPSVGNRTELISGTTKAVMACAYPISARCFSWQPLTVNAAPLRAQIAAAHAAITNFQNLDLFQDDAGHWHAVVAIGVDAPRHRSHWTVLAHAHPTSAAPADGAPLSWSADVVLSGAFDRPVDGNYDGKYFEDDGRLYLLYVKNFVPRPALRNGIVLQAMRSPTEPAQEKPVTLLMPGDRFGPLASETYAGTAAKLVEAPYISKIEGKYALVYSTGGYLTPGYKAGVAWSDRLLPPPGRRYRKVLDFAGRHPDVRYLLQSQNARWPGFTGGRVVGPGVASAIRGPGGAWWLYFAGYAPGDRLAPSGQADGSHRRPFFVPLHVAVPSDRSVAQATDAELADWMRPE